MKNVKKFLKTMREVINLIVKFFKRYGLSDEILTIPIDVKKMGFKVGFMNLGMTIIALVFAFMLKATNMMIEYRFILIGLILFMLYRGQQVVKESFRLFKNSEDTKFELIFEDEIILRGSQIIGKTSNKVLKYDTANKLYTVLSNEAVLNTIKNYLKNLWQQKIQHLFDIFEIISVTIMLIVAVITNESISQIIFIPVLLFFILLSFFSSAYISLNREEYYRKHRKYNNEQATLVNDLLRVPIIVKNDLNMRINKFQKTIVDSNDNISNFHQKMNLSRLFMTLIETFSQYGIIIFYLLGVKWSSINLATITEISATLLIIETALGQISQIAEILNMNNERVTILEKEEEDIELILRVYHDESKKISNHRIVKDIVINPFSIQYFEESKNDKAFTLTCKNQICINEGEIVILTGPSGSGKSTLMKMLTEKIRLEKSANIPSTSRYLMYDENLKFGSLSIFQELFCCEENPNLEKMQKILENLHLWVEIKSNCFDVWQWMKEKKFNQSLSNGQKQRLILAKMMYWLDNEIDVLVLDECTSGLDDKVESDSADAERILEFIVRYANLDKKRIIIISTHQNIEGVKKKLNTEYTFRNLKFVKDGEKNLVKEI